MNETLARSLGIDTGRVRLVVFMIGAGFAALAGVLLTPLTSVDPNMGVAWLIGAFMLVMVADASYLALAAAACVFGAAQVLISTFVSPILGSIAIAAVLAALVLRISPKGFSPLRPCPSPSAPPRPPAGGACPARRPSWSQSWRRSPSGSRRSSSTPSRSTS